MGKCYNCRREAEMTFLRRPVCGRCYDHAMQRSKPPKDQFRESVNRHMLMEKEIERQCSRFAPI